MVVAASQPGRDPFVSVVVIAHRPSPYLREALESAVGIGPEPAAEVLLVSNLPPEAGRELCAGLPARHLASAELGAGGKAGEGIDASRGSVVTFLDYDDRYTPERVPAVAEAFRRRSRLGFFRNAIDFVDAGGRSLGPGAIPGAFRRLAERPLGLEISNDRKSRTDPRLRGARPDLNSSAIAVRREVAEILRPYAPRIAMSLDSLLFYAGWGSPWDLLFDPRKLSQYRIHPENSSLGGTTLPGADRARLRAFDAVRARDYEVILEMVSRMARPELERDLKLRLYRDRVVELLGRPDASRRQIWRLVEEGRRTGLSLRAPALTFQSLLCEFAGLLSPRLGYLLSRQT